MAQFNSQPSILPYSFDNILLASFLEDELMLELFKKNNNIATGVEMRWNKELVAFYIMDIISHPTN